MVAFMRCFGFVNTRKVVEGNTQVFFDNARSGLRALGFDSFIAEESPYLIKHAEFMVSLRRQPESGPWRDRAVECGVPILFIENGWLDRTHATIHSQQGKFLQACWGDLCNLAPLSNRLARYDEARFGKVMANRKTPKSKYLILGQMPEDQQHRMDHHEMCEFYLNAIRRIRDVVHDARFAFRPHPKCITFRDLFRGLFENEQVEVSEGKELTDDLFSCSGVVTINSTAAVEAIRLGVPLAAIRTSSMFAGMTGVKTHVSRCAFLERLAQNQWTCHEFAKPETWQAILSNK